MTKIKFCGLSRLQDIDAVNELKPEYIGFVFASKSKRYISPDKAAELRRRLSPDIKAVGVFVRENLKMIAELMEAGVVDIAQFHGDEPEDDIRKLRLLTDKPVIKAFSVDTQQDIEAANASGADYVLLDSGKGGTGILFDWNLLEKMRRPYFLAGGLTVDNVGSAIIKLNPYAVDVSSGIETDGQKDRKKMKAFAAAVRIRGGVSGE